MKLRQKFAIIVAITMVQVLLLVILILNTSSKMQKMKNYQYVQATLEVDLGNTINLLTQVDNWGIDNTTVSTEFKENVEALGEKYAFISTDSILKSFPESFVHSLSEQIILWNAFSTKFALLSSSLSKIQNMNLPPDVTAYVASEGIRAAYAQFPDNPNTQELIKAADKIHDNMASVIRSGKKLSKLNEQCAIAITDIITVEEQKAKLYSLIMAIIACIIMGILILAVTDGIAKRIIKIRDKTSVLAKKDFTTTLKPEGSSEMRLLIENINNMVNQLNDFFVVVKDTAAKAIESSSFINESVNSTADATGKIDSNIDEINKEFEEITESIQLTLDKPTIETRFCFGYSLSSHDTEDYDNASDLSMKARKDVDYFMSENLKDFDYRIEQLKDKSNKYGLILRYSGQAKNDSLKSYTFIDDYRYPNRYKDLDYIPLSDNDRKTIIKALEVEKEKFTKRLKTYLKRFGLSKIDTWTYWRDV